jgi:hypothetical protein
MRLLALVWILVVASVTFAQTNTPAPETNQPDASQNPDATASQNPGSAGQTQPASHPVATTYSSGYELRLKIHKYASIATLPLFATELALGQSLYNTPETGSKKTAHGIVGAGIVGLFGVNAVTGVWNLWESRDDPNGRKLRIAHSVLMLAASGGFVATTATAPSIHRDSTVLTGNKALHRDLAIASISVGTVGYVLMLFKGK